MIYKLDTIDKLCNIISLYPNINQYYVCTQHKINVLFDTLSIVIFRLSKISDLDNHIKNIYNYITNKEDVTLSKSVLEFLSDIEKLANIPSFYDIRNNISCDNYYDGFVSVFSEYLLLLINNINHPILELAKTNIIKRKKMDNIYKLSKDRFNSIINPYKIQMKLISNIDNIYYLHPFWDDQIDNIDSHDILVFNKEELIDLINSNKIELVHKDKVFGVFLINKDDFNKLKNIIKDIKYSDNNEIENIHPYNISDLNIPVHIKNILDSKTINNIYQEVNTSGKNTDLVIVNREKQWSSIHKKYINRTKYNFPGGKKRYVVYNGNIILENDIDTLIREVYHGWFNKYISHDDIINNNLSNIFKLNEGTKSIPNNITFYIGTININNLI